MFKKPRLAALLLALLLPLPLLAQSNEPDPPVSDEELVQISMLSGALIFLGKQCDKYTQPELDDLKSRQSSYVEGFGFDQFDHFFDHGYREGEAQWNSLDPQEVCPRIDTFLHITLPTEE